MSNVIAAFSIDQAANLSRLSKARLISWDRDDFFVPTLACKNRSSPESRIYSFDDIVGLRTLALLRQQVSRQHLKKAAMGLKQHSDRPWSKLTLYVLKREVHFMNPATGIVEGAETGQGAVPMPLGPIAEQVALEANKLKRRDPVNVGQFEARRNIMGGRLCVAGTRVPVDTIKAYDEAGYSRSSILEQFPSLKAADIKAAIAFNADLTQAA